jgi:hypothetical protein
MASKASGRDPGIVSEIALRAKEGSRSMRDFCFAGAARVLAVLIAATLAPAAASAQGPTVQVTNGNAGWAGYSAPMPPVNAFEGGIVGPMCPGCFYTFPILAVYQCPAVITAQPGSDVIFMHTYRANGLLGGRPYLYHY